uniref:Uncharacterized protein n=1 Tax=Arundo donax TaxID=35708 RepID=A0A0A8ZFB7_ARUDO
MDCWLSEPRKYLCLIFSLNNNVLYRVII